MPGVTLCDREEGAVVAICPESWGVQATSSSFKFNPSYPSSSPPSFPSVHCRGAQPAAKHFDIIYRPTV